MCWNHLKAYHYVYDDDAEENQDDLSMENQRHWLNLMGPYLA